MCALEIALYCIGLGVFWFLVSFVFKGFRAYCVVLEELSHDKRRQKTEDPNHPPKTF